MTEYQKIAIGLLGLTHPEIHLSLREAQGSRPESSVPPLDSAPARTAHRRAPRTGAGMRALKFALAALLAGSRTVPLGDNGQLTKELGAYGARLRRG
jgi:hypothetical protein